MELLLKMKYEGQNLHHFKHFESLKHLYDLLSQI